MPLVACKRCLVLSVVSLVSRERSEAESVVPLVACGRCVVLSVVLPVSCECSEVVAWGRG